MDIPLWLVIPLQDVERHLQVHYMAHQVDVACALEHLLKRGAKQFKLYHLFPNLVRGLLFSIPVGNPWVSTSYHVTTHQAITPCDVLGTCSQNIVCRRYDADAPGVLNCKT